MLDVEQKREMIQFVLETEQQQGFSAIPCTNPDSFGARIDAPTAKSPLRSLKSGLRAAFRIGRRNNKVKTCESTADFSAVLYLIICVLFEKTNILNNGIIYIMSSLPMER